MTLQIKPLWQPPVQQPLVQQPPIQPLAQLTPVQQPLPSHHEDEQQVDNPQQAANQDDKISYLRSPAIKGKEFHPFQPDPSVQVMASLPEAIMLMTEELCWCDPPSSSSKSDDKADNKTDKGKKSDDKGKNNSSNNSGSSHNNNNNPNNSKGNKNSNNNKPNKASSSSASTNPLADKLGKEGKLTQQERQCCLDNNFCLFCGGPGHTATNCNKASLATSGNQINH